MSLDSATPGRAMPRRAAHSRTGDAIRGRPSGLWLTLVLLSVLVLLAGCERTETQQTGYRGLAMEQLRDPGMAAATAARNQIPPPEFRDAPDPEAPSLAEVMQNVQVLNDLTLLEFTRLMQALSTWVAPEAGCEYCHNVEDLASDEKYTKVVARRMLQMTRDINTSWQTHVKGTGVTCWTCHRGQAVPSDIWFTNPGPTTAARTRAKRAGQNTPGVSTVGYSSLPFDPLSLFLAADNPISVQALHALPMGDGRPIVKAEATYALMMYISDALGVNCTYCHVTRAMGRWEQSTPQRVTAWVGIRMVRHLNAAYLEPLKPQFPDYRLGPLGDGPKLACKTCHKGAFKPLLGVSMLGDYPELAGVVTTRPAPWELEPLTEQTAAEGEQPPAEPTAPPPQ